LLDPLDLDLMKPLVVEVKPVTEDAIFLQIESIECGRARVSVFFLAFLRVGYAVVGPRGIVCALAKLEFTQVRIGPGPYES